MVFQVTGRQRGSRCHGPWAGTRAEGWAGARGSESEQRGERRSLSCPLPMLSSGFPETLQVDQGPSPGAKAGDADLDYEIVDRAGECTPPGPVQPLTSPGLSRRISEKTGVQGGRRETGYLCRGWAEEASVTAAGAQALGNPGYLAILAHALFTGRPFCLPSKPRELCSAQQ